MIAPEELFKRNVDERPIISFLCVIHNLMDCFKILNLQYLPQRQIALRYKGENLKKSHSDNPLYQTQGLQWNLNNG